MIRPSWAIASKHATFCGCGKLKPSSRSISPRLTLATYEQNATLREVIDFIASGALSGGDAELFRRIVENLLDHDPFLLLADYQAYIDIVLDVLNGNDHWLTSSRG
jgi:glucan phosphorylase